MVCRWLCEKTSLWYSNLFQYIELYCLVFDIISVKGHFSLLLIVFLFLSFLLSKPLREYWSDEGKNANFPFWQD